jgi:K+-sensing histidine kinase KdpD
VKAMSEHSDSIEQIQKDIQTIKERNKRVESNKAWETSWTRRISIACLTYIVVCLFFLYIGVADPFINAIVPVIGFLLSTLSIGLIKSMWIRYYDSHR